MTTTTLIRPTAPPVRPTAQAQRTKREWVVEDWDGDKTGEKVIVYAESGKGKTTLASLSPNPVFIGVDPGGSKLENPITHSKLKHIPGIKNYLDVRSALNACIDFNYDTIVLDTITDLEKWTADHVMRTIPTPKGGAPTGLKSYGWNDGFNHLYDAMRLIVLDCDRLIGAGKNVILIAQTTTHKFVTDEGTEYLREGPQLYNGKPLSILELWKCWADHIFRITFQSETVAAGKKRASGDTTRVINTTTGLAYDAKTRGRNIPALVSFATPADDSIWQFVFKKG